MLLTCHGFIVLRSEYGDESGAAALKGTAIGRGVELWHKGDPLDSAISKSLGEVEGVLSEKEIAEVTKTVGYYAEDPRNQGSKVVLSSLEQEVEFEYKGFWFKGHFDQIRREADGLYMWDLKHTKYHNGVSALSAYAAQLAAYTYAARKVYGEPVKCGGILRTTGYLGPRSNELLPVGERPVFFNADWPDGTVEFLLDQCVARLSSDVTVSPGGHCSFCPMVGIQNCVRRFHDA